MKQLGQSINNTQLWVCLVVKVKSDDVKELIGIWNVRSMNQGKLDLLKGFPGGSEGKESAYNAGDLSSIPGLGRYPGEGKGRPLQYCGLENPMACIVHGVKNSWTSLNDFHFSGFKYLKKKNFSTGNCI